LCADTPDNSATGGCIGSNRTSSRLINRFRDQAGSLCPYARIDIIIQLVGAYKRFSGRSSPRAAERKKIAAAPRAFATAGIVTRRAGIAATRARPQSAATCSSRRSGAISDQPGGFVWSAGTLEHIPFRSKRSERNMLKLLNAERFLIGRMIPSGRETL